LTGNGFRENRRLPPVPERGGAGAAEGRLETGFALRHNDKTSLCIGFIGLIAFTFILDIIGRPPDLMYRRMK
jgi:hypothetical protein